ncbi:hypothetical protein M409DRAFT_38029 [Zasmidium cellare ATCC 36951]|uniref:Cercosporin MFS transporter CTB4 n=1 Tax=Zasmidium cellare ATCC 36951 TaxID=1080233 RepID=A0A6A6BWL6_ZASCE|nr:uncharacterized protein M409DRAFT_38029 [Zasmidium cellare ATCC 36951]KAF2158983.1 hypothetical protein M409DRAFT_38029 [Zasmidium cellare ATCC 36951]
MNQQRPTRDGRFRLVHGRSSERRHLNNQQLPNNAVDSCNIVEWEGDDDPACPLNWPTSRKAVNVTMVSVWTLVTPLASSMIAPAIPLILDEFKITNSTLGTFVVSIFVLGYALGPMVLAPLSEMYGRLPVYHVCNFLFVIWTLACAFAPNIGALLAFRFLQGVAGVCPLTIGSGTIADLIRPEHLGLVMSIYSTGPLMGPVAGPIAGSFLSEAAGWRWVFRTLAIAAGVLNVISTFTMQETSHATLLWQKTRRLRRETGNDALCSKLHSGLNSAERFKRAIVRPTKMLLFSPIVLFLSMYIAVVYGYLYLLFTTTTDVYEQQYHFSSGIASLTYLGIGVAEFLALFAFAMTSDRLTARLANKKQTVKRPEYRLPVLAVGALLTPIGLFWYGWSAQKKLPWIMPVIGSGWLAAGLILTFMPVCTYLVEAFPIYAASAMAANTILRSLVGAFLPLAGPSLYRSLGLGWGNSLLGFISLAMWPVSLVFYRYGERIRKSSDLVL